MASANAAATLEVAVSDELAAARSQIATLTFEARDAEAVTRRLHIKVGFLEDTNRRLDNRNRDLSADIKRGAESSQVLVGFAESARKKLFKAEERIEQLTSEIEQLAAENAELNDENEGLWNEVVGWAVQDRKRRRLK